MRRRIIGSLVGASIGLLAGLFIHADLGISETTEYLACGAVGLLLGNVVSILMDVFSGPAGPVSVPDKSAD